MIRKATRDDVPQILEIYNEIILNTTAVYSYKPHTLQMRYDWFDERMKNNFPVFVAEENGGIAGFSTYGYFRAYPAYKYTVENTVHVAKNHRGKGIAKLLLKAIIDDAKEKDFHTMIAVVDADNTVSIKLHEAFGFVEVGFMKQVGYKFERWLDLKFLQLTFNTPANPADE